MAAEIYLDHAATTPTDERVVAAMLPYFTERSGNPSSVYGPARTARRAVDRSRDTLAEILACKPNEVIFTSCGTESSNLAIRGVAFARESDGRHLVTASTEHHAVLHSFELLERRFGFEVTYLDVDRTGQIDLGALEAALRPDTTLVSIMYANNEIGTIHPLAEISRLLRPRGIIFHTDAVQAGGSLELDVEKLGVDLLSLSGHKLYAPKGVGALYIRRGTPLLPLMVGGGQERGLRSGTENVTYIVGMARAAELAFGELTERQRHYACLRDRLVQGVLERIPRAQLTGHPTQRLPNSASFVFEGADGESILLNLDQEGIYASSGSACTAGSLEVSHVLKALGLPPELAAGSLRLTTGLHTTEAEIDAVLEILPPVIERVRGVAQVGVR